MVAKPFSSRLPPENHFDFETTNIDILECAKELEGVQKIIPPLRNNEISGK